MSILSTSPTSTRHFDMNIAAALGDINAAVIVQQLDYWLKKEGIGTVIEGRKYVYNTFVDWVNSQFKWLSVWQFRKAMTLLRSLEIVRVIRYKSKEWNQTNYYSLNCDRLAEFLNQEIAEAGLALAPDGERRSAPASRSDFASFGSCSFPAQSIEISEMRNSAPQDERTQTLEMRDSKLSYIETKNTNQKRTTKQNDRVTNKSESIVAASPKKALEEKKSQTRCNPHSEGSSAPNSQKKQESEVKQSNLSEKTNVARVDYIVNKNWKALIPLLDSTGIPINKTLKDLLKLYPSERVESAIAIVKAKKREQYIPNLSGYFVSALKGDWGSQQVAESERNSEEIDKGAIFRHWYDLSKELGYCSGQEMREGE